MSHPCSSRSRLHRQRSRRRSSIVWLASLLCALAAILVPRQAAAIDDPNLTYWTLETEHFSITYPHPLEPLAERLARVAEAAHERLSVDLAFDPSSKTQILITDDSEIANGSATPIPFNTINLFASAPPDISPLGDYDDWLLELQTHEYTHTLHTGNISGIPAVLNEILGRTFAPNSAQPRAIIEGLAVVYESHHSSAGRIRSTLFDMYVRADVLADNVITLDQLFGAPSRWPGGNVWYLYGSRFLQWITDIYGKGVMTAVSHDYGASLVPFGINRSIRKFTGRTYVELWDGFMGYLERRYRAQVAEVEARGLREGKRLTAHGFDVYYPDFSPTQPEDGRLALVYYRSDANSREGIYRLFFDPATGEVEEDLVARTAARATPRHAPNGDLYFEDRAAVQNIYLRNDLHRLPKGETAESGLEGSRERLTNGFRAEAPDVSPDGKQIVFTTNEAGTRYLKIAALDESGIDDVRVLVPSRRFEQAYTPRFSPNGKYVAYSVWTEGGYRDIRVVELASGTYRNITRDRSMDMQPAWSPDGRTLYFVSDRTGISNVYAFDVEDETLQQVTNVRTGAYCPAISPDGKTLVYVGYTTIGFDLYTMPLDVERYLLALPPPEDRPQPPPAAPPVEFEKSRYNPLWTLAPRTYAINVEPGSYSANAFTISAEANDLVGHHGIAAALTTEPDAPQPTIDLQYIYRGLPVNLSLSYFHTVRPRGGFRIDEQEIVYDEVTDGWAVGMAAPILSTFINQSVDLSYNVAVFRGDQPIPVDSEPYSTRTVLPPEGTMGIVNLGYSFSTVEGELDANGSVRGMSLRLDADFADDATGAEYSLISFRYRADAFIKMPWPGSHTLGLYSAGGIAGGTFPRQSQFFVGGSRLDFDFLEAIQTGVFDSGFVLRGYEPGSYSGREFVLQSAEYAFPLLRVDRGISTLPIFLRRIDGLFFVDYGGAFNDFDLEQFRFFRYDGPIQHPQLHASVGGELSSGWTVGHRASTSVRIGYAYGFSAEAIPGGQIYFLGGTTF